MDSVSGNRHPDVVIFDGAVWTGSIEDRGIQALAVSGGRITAMGTNAQMRDLVGPGTEVVSAGGNTVMPGIVDAHNHVRLGSNPRAVSLFGATSVDEIRARIAAHVQANPDIDWIEGEGWSYEAVPGGGPRAEMIDDVCDGKPAWLFSYDVHTVWLNSEALRRWRAPEGPGSLPFGRLEVDAESGRPTGWVHDFAVMGIHPRGQQALEAVIPGYGKEAQYERLVRNLRDATRFGITTIVEPQNGLADIELFTRAQAEGELRSRLVAALIHTPEDSADTLLDVVAARHEYSDARLRLGPVKLYIDDVVEPCTAAMLAPYATPPHGVGETFWTPPDFADLIVRLEALGLQAFVHGTGDRGIRTALDGLRRWTCGSRRPGHATSDRARGVPQRSRHRTFRRPGGGRVHAAAALRSRRGTRVARQRRPGTGALRMGDAQSGGIRRDACLLQRLERRGDGSHGRHLHRAHARGSAWWRCMEPG